jgi:hypothetical protein
MLKNWIVSEGNFIRKNMKLRCDARNKNRLKSEKGKEWRWFEPNVRPRRGRDSKKKSRNAWRQNLGET